MVLCQFYLYQIMVLYYYIFPRRLCIYFGFAYVENNDKNVYDDFVLRFGPNFCIPPIHVDDKALSLYLLLMLLSD